MKGKSEIGWGILIILVQLIGIAQYIKNGCISILRMPTFCGDAANNALIGTFMFIGLGLYLILSGFVKMKNKK